MRLLPERLNSQVRAKVVKMGIDPKKVEGLGDWDQDTLKRQHIRHQIKSLGEYAQIIAQKEFFLMTAPNGSTLYLGDHPVVMHNDEKPRGPFGNLGLGAPYIQIYLPLAGNVLLCAYDRAVLGQLMMNRADSLSSTLYVYAAKQSACAIRMTRDAGIFCVSRFGGER